MFGHDDSLEDDLDAEELKASQISEEDLKKFRHSFDHFTDEEGVLATEDIGKVLNELGQFPTAAELEDLKVEVDTDGDGTVDFEEFSEFMRHRQKELASIELLVKQQTSLQRYSELRAALKPPYDKEWMSECENKHLKMLFRVDLQQSKVWYDKPLWDLYLFVRQAHPLFGFMCHKYHPLTTMGRFEVIFAGFGMASAASLFPRCDNLFQDGPGADQSSRGPVEGEWCLDTCNSSSNGICDDGLVWHNENQGQGICDFGTDCYDCGIRYLDDFNDIWILDGKQGVYCLSSGTETWVQTAVWGLFVSLWMLSIRNLAMCPCFVKERKSVKFCCRYTSRFLSVCMMGLSMSLIYFAINTYELDPLKLLSAKCLSYVYSLLIECVVFSIKWPLEKKAIKKAGGIEAYYKQSRDLTSIEQSVTASFQRMKSVFREKKQEKEVEMIRANSKRNILGPGDVKIQVKRNELNIERAHEKTTTPKEQTKEGQTKEGQTKEGRIVENLW